MKKLKIFFIFLMVFIISGCESVDYNLTINDKLQISEKVNFIFNNEYILEYNESLNLFLSGKIKSYQSNNKYVNYKFNSETNSYNSNITAQRLFLSLDSYISSPIFKFLFEDIELTINDDYKSFKTVGYKYDNIFGEHHEPEFYVGDINIKIRLHNNVVESNADYHNEKINTLEWKISNQDIDKTIYFMIDNNKRYDIILIDYILNNLVSVIFYSSLTVLVIGISLFIYIRNKKNNKI